MTDLERARPRAVASWAAIARRRMGVGAPIFLVVAALAVALVFLSRPIWRVEASLRLGAPAAMGGLPVGGAGSPVGLFSLFQQMTGDPFANEQELLSSRTVVEGVVRDNALDVQVDAPRGWYRDSLFLELRTVADWPESGTYRVHWGDDGRIHVRRTEPTSGPESSVTPGATLTFGPVVARFRAWHPGMPRAVELRTRPLGEAVRRTSSRLRVERVRRDANLVALHYDDPDPGLATDVVRSAIGHYTVLRAELSRRESGETVDSLGTVIERTHAELTAAEAGLASFERENRLVDPGAQSKAFVEQQADVLADLARARGELEGVDQVVQRLDSIRDPGAAWPGLAAHPTFLGNETLGGMLSTLVSLQQQRIDLASRRTENSRELRALDDRIAYLDGSLRALVRDYRRSVAQQVVRLEARAAQFDSLLASAPAAAMELGRRERRVRQLSEIYLFADQRRRQESIRDALSFASVQVVDPPDVLFKPVWPRKKLGLGVGLLIALGASMLGMIAVERADHSVRTASDLTALLRLPVVAALEAPRDGVVQIAPGDRAAILRGIVACGVVHAIVVTPVGTASSDAEAVAGALREDHGSDRALLPERIHREGDSTAVRCAEPSAVAPADGDGAVVLLVARQGVTNANQAMRARRLLERTGARVCGAVLLCASPRLVEEAWL